ncbi:MAG: hypothetical protein ACT4N8_10850 [Sphingosinicella sp.]
MIFIVGTVIAALVILGYWGAILWLAGRVDRKHLERERLTRVFGDVDR